MPFLSVLLTTIVVIGIQSNAFAKKFHIPANQHTTSTENGHPCTYLVTGWVDIQSTWSFPFVKIGHYDITLSGPCGTKRFQGMVTVDNGGNYGWQMNVTDGNNQPIPIGSIDPTIITYIQDWITIQMVNFTE